MTWAAVAVAGAGLVSSYMNKDKGGGADQMVGGYLSQMNSKEVKEYLEKLRQEDQDRWAATLNVNRPNQVGMSGQSSTWDIDPKTGKATQTLKLGESEQKRRDMFNTLAEARMGDAAAMSPGISKMAGGIDWESLGLGKMGNAALNTGIKGGSDKYGSITSGNAWNMVPSQAQMAGSMGGNFLNPTQLG